MATQNQRWAVWSGDARTRRPSPERITPLQALAREMARPRPVTPQIIQDRTRGAHYRRFACLERDWQGLLAEVADKPYPDHSLSAANRRLRYYLKQADEEADRYLRDRNRSQTQLSEIMALLDDARVPVKLDGQRLDLVGRVRWLTSELARLRAPAVEQLVTG